MSRAKRLIVVGILVIIAGVYFKMQELMIRGSILIFIGMVWELSSGKPSYSSTNKIKRKRIPKNIQHEVWRRDQGRCIEYGSNRKLEFDHIIPLSKGGSDTTRNLQLLCQNCNRRKHAKI